MINGVIDHALKTLTSMESAEVYHTQEPAEAFHKRIEFCMNLHNEAVQAMRFADSQGKPEYMNEEARKEMEKVR